NSHISFARRLNDKSSIDNLCRKSQKAGRCCFHDCAIYYPIGHQCGSANSQRPSCPDGSQSRNAPPATTKRPVTRTEVRDRDRFAKVNPKSALSNDLFEFLCSGYIYPPCKAPRTN